MQTPPIEPPTEPQGTVQSPVEDASPPLTTEQMVTQADGTAKTDDKTDDNDGARSEPNTTKEKVVRNGANANYDFSSLTNGTMNDGMAKVDYRVLRESRKFIKIYRKR